jgi:serine/threonine protein phosphatase PrpC
VQLEFAKSSLIGHRLENQDRVAIVSAKPSALLIVVDGMGGHAQGAQASEATVACLTNRFREAGQPLLDPQGFLISALSAAHDEVVALGSGISVEKRPRATCAVCLVQDDRIYCAHVGDSRIYQLRDGAILHRSRDHSRVELLLHEGVIQEQEVSTHPMRNFVECCLGGSEPLPDMSVAPARRLLPKDVVLLCSDGLWSGADDNALLVLTEPERELEQALAELARGAVEANAPHGDNTSAVAVRATEAGT